MSYTIATTVRNAVVNAAVDLIDVGSSAAAGSILFRSSTTTIASCLMKNPAFGSASSGSAAMDTTGTVSGTVSPAGSSTIDRFRITDRDGTTLFDGSAGSVATSGADINLSSVVVNQNDVIEVTGLTCSLPATAGV